MAYAINLDLYFFQDGTNYLMLYGRENEMKMGREESEEEEEEE